MTTSLNSSVAFLQSLSSTLFFRELISLCCFGWLQMNFSFFFSSSRSKLEKCCWAWAIIRERKIYEEDTSDGRMGKEREESGGIRSNCREWCAVKDFFQLFLLPVVVAVSLHVFSMRAPAHRIAFTAILELFEWKNLFVLIAQILHFIGIKFFLKIISWLSLSLR